MRSKSPMISLNFSPESRTAKSLYGDLSRSELQILKDLVQRTGLSVKAGELIYMNGWYVRHAGLLKLAEKRRCTGIHSQPVLKSCDPAKSRWVFKATVFKSSKCKGFNGYGDADPSNVSALMHGAEMRVAETRAVNRALRKAYGIGICSVEEVGSFAGPLDSHSNSRKAPQPANGNGDYGGRTVRDRLCQLIRQHRLDAALV